MPRLRIPSTLLACFVACGDSPPGDATTGGSDESSSGAPASNTSAPSTTTSPTDDGSNDSVDAGTTNVDDSGSDSADESSSDSGPTISPCDGLAPVGTWEEITPPVQPLPDQEPCPYGGAFAMNPQDPAMVWAGSCNQGIWKTSDCGATWAHINTGENGDVLDAGRQWTFAIDPGDPDVLYTNSGYGSFSNGAFKSIDGGVSWSQLWPPQQPELQGVVEYDFVAAVEMDPDDSQHLLLSFHATCAAPHSEACFGESEDGGDTWRLIDGEPQWAGGEGQFIYFLDDRETWLWGSQSNGLWRTDDAGESWTAVTDNMAQGHAGGQLYRASDGAFYLPALEGILRSADGTSWDTVPNSGNVMLGLTGNGTTMWASRGFPWDPSDDLYQPFWTASESDGLTWSQLDSPMLSNGGQLAYDEVHHLLYSSNLGAGMWRVVVE
ncbi:MAG TPA: hypothetical protein VG755_13720 [Nannocystaceae bacterium]|nr:hypothetical protein [Nannocystaceae bacterium]